MLDPQPTERGQGLNSHPHGYWSGSFLPSHNGNSEVCLCITYKVFAAFFFFVFLFFLLSFSFHFLASATYASFRQHQILNPLSKARDQTCISWIVVGFTTVEPQWELQFHVYSSLKTVSFEVKILKPSLVGKSYLLGTIRVFNLSTEQVVLIPSTVRKRMLSGSCYDKSLFLHILLMNTHLSRGRA